MLGRISIPSPRLPDKGLSSVSPDHWAARSAIPSALSTNDGGWGMSWRSKARWARPLSSHRRLVERELTIGRPESTSSSSTQTMWAAQERNRGRQTSKSVRSRARSWSRSWTSVTSKPSALRCRASTGFHEFTSAASQHRSTLAVSGALILEPRSGRAPPRRDRRRRSSPAGSDVRRSRGCASGSRPC